MSSLTTPPSKISLPSNTSISLHDRFTKLAAKTRQSPTSKAVVQPKVTLVGAASLPSTRASAKNRKLALQMANRPSVRAALKIKKKSIKQRLGTMKTNGARNPTQAQRPKIGLIKKTSFKRTRPISKSPNKPARLGGPAGRPVQSAGGRQSRFAPTQTVGIDPSRLSGVKFSRSSSANAGNRGGVAKSFGGGAGARGGRRSLSARRPLNTSMNSSIRRVGAGAGLKKPLGRKSLKSRLGLNQAVAAGNLRGNNRMGNRLGKPNNVAGVAAVNNGNGQRRGGGGGAGRGGPRGNLNRRGGGRGGNRGNNRVGGQKPQVPKSRENLDMDLDQYMAKSKTHLDASLDAYMATTSNQQ